MSEFRTVALTADIPNNSSVALQVEGMDLLVCHSGGEFMVVENRCSHQDQPLERGRIRNGYIFCPVHGMRYKLTDGGAVGQLTRKPINVFETRVLEGEVQVRLTA